ncbi:1,6-anhydro-N-acetylmuramyl-L-alanine amidase AmpD [Methylophilaceae bacterium]|jgi:AmpD protein|nr:1,6-anhydro-N-acetylmuramyl-L-alanine amidase AmpD [Methylophilaceae bacterium]
MNQNNFFDNDGWLKNANRVDSDNFNQRPTLKKDFLVVIHSISLPPGQFNNSFIEDFFQNKLNPTLHPYFETIKDLKVSAHFLIKRTGELIQFVSCHNRAWHAGESSWKGLSDCNDFSIGIELEGTEIEPYEEIQYKVLLNLLVQLKKEYNIIDIVGHSDIAPHRKTDPGPSFDWNKIKT